MLPFGYNTVGPMLNRQFIRDKDDRRLKYLCLDVEVYYECEIYKMLEADPDMQKFFDNYYDVGPFKFRDCYFGRKTGPMKFYHRMQPREKFHTKTSHHSIKYQICY